MGLSCTHTQTISLVPLLASRLVLAHAEFLLYERPLLLSERAALPAVVPQWSSLSRVLHGPPRRWTITTLRRALLRDLAAHSPAPHHAADPGLRPAAMVALYASTIFTSALGSHYTLSLVGSPVPSPLSAPGYWTLHCRHCLPCAARGDWATAFLSNPTNRCYIAHILSWIHNGWLPSFHSLPDPFFFPNSASLALAPRSTAAEHAATVAFGAVLPGPSNSSPPSSAFNVITRSCTNSAS